MNEQYQIIVSGKVQGVFFRASAKDKAMELGLTGFVKNISTGQVEILVEGEGSIMDQFLKWCRKGPQFSRVEDVSIEKKEFEGKHSSFEILH